MFVLIMSFAIFVCFFRTHIHEQSTNDQTRTKRLTETQICTRMAQNLCTFKWVTERKNANKRWRRSDVCVSKNRTTAQHFLYLCRINGIKKIKLYVFFFSSSKLAPVFQFHLEAYAVRTRKNR